MTKFERSLASIVGKPSNQRPFVCSGQPSSSSVWVVGFNAATAGGNWWRFWSSECGFDYHAWRKDYDAERAKHGKRASSTRRRIDRLKTIVPDLLETNIYAKPSTKMSNMPPGNTMAFDLLLATFKPKVIVAHGVKAVEHLTDWNGGTVIPSPHLSRASYSKVDEIACHILEV